jgi:hypothetical protein
MWMHRHLICGIYQIKDWCCIVTIDYDLIHLQ